MTPALEFIPSTRPTLLFVLCHGVGCTARHMSPLAQRLAAEYPQAAIVSMNAPRPYDGAPQAAGYQWFSTVGLNDVTRAERIAAAMPEFVAAVREQTARFELDWQRTALAGFSQGAIMSLEATQAEPRLVGRVIAFSGRHATPPEHAPQDTTVHLLHGMDDRVVPPGPAVDSAKRLVALGGDVTADVLPGIGHELHPQLIDKAIEQLRNFLPQRLWREALIDALAADKADHAAQNGGSQKD
jgi:phospholipase/carboxylesterase